MKKLLALALLLGGCGQFDVTPDEKRWSSLNGETVFVVKGATPVVHAKGECPEVQNPKGDVLKATVRGGRLVDANGLYLNSEREKPPLCPLCVR